MYSEQLGRQETSHQTLLSRIDKKTSGRPPNLPHRLPSLPLATLNLDLKQRLWNWNKLPDLPLSPSQPSTRMSSSRSTERGKCLSQPSTQKSELNSPVPLKKTRTESTQLLDPLLRQSRAMILRQPWQLGEERELESDTEPSLLSRMSRNPRLTRNLSLKNQRSTSQHSHGLDQKGRLIPNCPTTWSGRSNSLEFTPWTLRRRYDHSPTPPVVRNFQTRSGRMLSEGKPSVWTPSSVDSSRRRTMSSRSRSLETLNSLLERLSPLRSSRMEGSGPLHGTEPSGLPRLLSRIDCENSPDMESISSPCSPLLTPTSIPESSHSIKRFGNELDQSETSSYQTTINSQISKSLTSIQLECQHVQRGRQEETRPENQSEERGGRDLNRVISGTTELVDRKKRTVDETMCATDARNEVTKGRTVGNLPLETSPRKRPRYLRSLIWSNPIRQPLISPTAYCTIFDKPLPRPPEDEYENLDAISTISRNPDLFKIITPINVSRFQQLLD